MSLRTVAATRYVTPLREGGSVPAIVEADDQGTYVLKFRAAAQGKKALVADLIGCELARAVGLPVPEVVLITLDPVLGRSEPDPELAGPLKQSGGINFGIDFLPGAIGYEPVLNPPTAELASQLVWFDALIANVDRTPRNPNLLWWGKRMWLIDHGAAIYPHHNWAAFATQAETPFARVRDHVLLRWASAIAEVDDALAAKLPDTTIAAILASVPNEWLDSDGDPAAARDAYREFFVRRLAARARFVEEAIRARS